MTRRVLCVRTAAPDVGDQAWRRALLEDVLEVLVEIPGVEVAIACCAATRADADAVVWPTVPVLEVVLERAGGVDDLAVALAAAEMTGADEVTLVAPDAPDLPPLLLGKLARVLSAPLPPSLAVLPARGGALVALALRPPAAGWLGAVSLDAPGELARLRAAAPTPAALAVVPGWHRLAGRADAAALDPRQEGWERTRALLQGRP